MRRFSIRSLMASILACALSLTALGKANDLWAGLMLLLALAAVDTAVLGASLLRGRERAWWLGFAVFGGGYLIAGLCPWQPTPLGTPLLDLLRDTMFANTAMRLSDEEALSVSLRVEKSKEALVNMKRKIRNFAHDPAVFAVTNDLQKAQAQLAAHLNAGPPREKFVRVGQSLLAFLIGLFGGMVAEWFYARRQRQEPTVGISMRQSSRRLSISDVSDSLWRRQARVRVFHSKLHAIGNGQPTSCRGQSELGLPSGERAPASEQSALFPAEAAMRCMSYWLFLLALYVLLASDGPTTPGPPGPASVALPRQRPFSSIGTGPVATLPHPPRFVSRTSRAVRPTVAVRTALGGLRFTPAGKTRASTGAKRPIHLAREPRNVAVRAFS
jgi:hypothetical protein